MITLNEVKEWFENNFSGYQWVSGYNDDNLKLPSWMRSFERVDVKEGEEGDWATEIYSVILVTFKNGAQGYYRKSGYYRSHDGEYWDGSFYQVEPVKKEITDWKIV